MFTRISRRNRHLTLVALAALALVVPCRQARAAEREYPNREIELVVSFPPGGPADTAARIVQPKLSAVLGVPVVVVNKTGGGGAVGTDYAAKAKPDGYTIYSATNSVFTISPVVQKGLSYQMTDFTPIGAYAADLLVITAKAGAPWKTLEEFVEHAKKNPGKFNYGSAGFGTVSFFTMEMFKLSYGLDIAHVPFQGTGPAKNAILGGHVTLASSGFGSFAPLFKSGELIPLVTTATKRVPAFPNVPTMAEKGFPEASLNIWLGLYVPAKTPKPVVDTLVKALAQAAKDPSLAAALDKAGMFAEYHGPEETAKILQTETTSVRKVAEKLGIGK